MTTPPLFQNTLRPPQQKKEDEKPAVRMRAFDDPAALRSAVFDSVHQAASNLQPVSNNRYTLSISDVDWADNPAYNAHDVHQARIQQRSLNRRLRGTWNLIDTQTGRLLQKQRKTLANVPYILDNGGVMDSGNLYYIRNQQRLKHGIYVRQKENNELVANVNAADHEGPTHSYKFDPTTGRFDMEVSKNNVPLYTFLHAMGASDDELKEAWGDKLFETNKAHAREVNTRKLYDRFVRKKYQQPGDKDSDAKMRERIQEQAAAIKFAKEVTRSTLGTEKDHLDKDAVLSASKKLVQLARGEVESDSRDNMAFQSFHGPEDLFAERLRLDDGRVRRQLLNKLTFLSNNNPNLDKIPTGALSKQIGAVITQSGLASPAEEVNPYEQYSKLFSVTRMGAGAINDSNAIPDSAREVNNSQYGFIDPLQTPESLRAGVDLYISSSAKKGSDGNLYIPVINARTGKEEYKNPVDLMEATVTLQSEWAKGDDRISAFDRDRQPRMGIKKDQIDYIFPNAQSGYNNLSNLIPMLGNVKGQRVSMAARMITQALPLEGGESPLVQSRMPGAKDESYEDKIGLFSTVNSDVEGMVRKVTDREIIIDTPEGQKKFPFVKNAASNRKCVVGDTKIYILRETGKIWRGKIKDYSWQPGDKTRTIQQNNYNTGWEAVTAVQKVTNKDKQILEIVTKSGRKVQVTEDHSLVTLNDIGALVPLFPSECIVGKTRIPIASLALSEKREYDYRAEYVRGAVTGLYLAEGYLKRAVAHTSVHQAQSKFPKKGDAGRKKLEKFKANDGNIYSEVNFAVEGQSRKQQVLTYLQDWSAENKALPIKGGVRIANAALACDLFNYCGRYSGTKYIADELLGESKAFRQGLIAGFFSGDACLHTDINGAIQLCVFVTSERLRDDLVDILASLNVSTTILFSPRKLINDKWADAYGFRVRTESIKKLKTWFIYEDRQKLLDDLLNCQKNKRQITGCTEKVPVSKASIKLLKNLRPKKFWELKKWRELYRYGTKGAIPKKLLKDISGNFGLWAASDIEWDLITEIKLTEFVTDVYDLTVANSHCFCVGGGLVVHNTYTTQTPVVQPGQQITKGQLLAKSNFTDDTGAMAQGFNARAVVMPWRGSNTMDAIIISKSMADRMKSQHAYQHKVDWAENIKQGKKTFMGAFPSVYDAAQLDTIDDDGVVRIGTVLNQGDPMVLKADVNTKPVDRIHRKGAQSLTNSALEWDHEDPGQVVEVFNDKNGVNVVVSSLSPTRLADKLANRYGAKGVIAEIVPDDQMPQTPDGPAEIVYSPIGNIGRVNYSMLHEHLLGRIAKKTGKPIKIESFDPKEPDTAAYVLRLAKEHGINPRDPVLDPETGKLITGTDGKGIGWGYSYVQKLHHSAEGKTSDRSFGHYTADEQPASGGSEGAKRVALMHTNALISHGAYNMLADARRIRGQKNDDYWAAFMRGYQPPEPEMPQMYHKFMAHLQGSGINVTPTANKLKILALTNNDVKQLVGNREVTSSETIKWEGDKKGIKGGLFDPAIFGEYGEKWGFIKPAQPMLNPVMEEPARRMLGLTQAKLNDVIAGRAQLNEFGTGPQAIRKALGKLNVDHEMSRARETIASTRGTKRDEAVKKLQFLKAAKDNDLTPADWMLDRIPVIPPKFRPVSEMGGTKTALIADVNYLYKQMIDHDKTVKELEGQIGDAGEEYLQSYNYFKQITGLMDPSHPKLQQKRVTGLLRHVFGEGSSKYGMVQRNLLGGGVDVVSRNVITMSPNLDLDEVGLPINSAYEIYKPVIIRKLAQSGVPLTTAQDMYDNKDKRAKAALLQSVQERPVVLDRSPILHQYGIMAFWPKLVKGNSIQMNQYTMGGFGADLDGDAMNFQLPISDDAVQDAIRLMLPSQNLLNMTDGSPNFTPQEDYIAGLYEATRSRKKKSRPKVFATMADFKQAWVRGEVQLSDEVEILRR